MQNDRAKTAVSIATEVQDQMMRLPKLMPVIAMCRAQFDEMALALSQLRSAFMAFENEARKAIDEEVRPL